MRVFNNILKISFHKNGEELKVNNAMTRFSQPMFLNPDKQEHLNLLNSVLFSDSVIIAESEYQVVSKKFDFDHTVLIVNLSDSICESGR